MLSTKIPIVLARNARHANILSSFMKKTLFIAFAFAFVLTSCNKKEASTVKSNGLTHAKESNTSTGAVAYVEVDSITTQYTFSKEQNEILQRQQEQYRATLEQKQKQLQAAYQTMQQKAQSGGFTSQAQMEQAQASLAKQQQAAEKLQAQYAQAMAEKTTAYQNALRDSLNHFLADYNKDKKFSIILAKQGDNVLYADKSLDITAEVIAGLNKRYKK